MSAAPRPRWTYVVPWAGTVPELSARQWQVLGLLCAAELFDNFDTGIMLLALKQVQAGLAIGERQVGWMTGLIRLGVLPAIGLSLLADRVGRRKLLLFTVLGLAVCTFATAFSQTPWHYLGLQFLVRSFAYAETALAVVVLTEELRERDRGWGIGMMGAIGSMGHAVAAIAFGFVEVLPHGWRGLYALGAVPLLLLGWLRRRLPETKRFERHARERSSGSSWWLPALLLLRSYPRRVAALAAAMIPVEFVTMTAYTFAPKSLQELHGFAPRTVGLLYVGGGAIGILGNIVAGQLGDRLGRRLVLAGFIAIAGVSFGGFYAIEGAAAAVFFWILQVFALLGIGVTFKAIGSELFPTSHRSTASSVRAALGTLGGVAGLALESFLYGLSGSHATAILWMLPALILPPLVLWLAVPETAGRRLEDVSPERVRPESDC